MLIKNDDEWMKWLKPFNWTIPPTRNMNECDVTFMQLFCFYISFVVNEKIQVPTCCPTFSTHFRVTDCNNATTWQQLPKPEQTCCNLSIIATSSYGSTAESRKWQLEVKGDLLLSSLGSSVQHALMIWICSDCCSLKLISFVCWNVSYAQCKLRLLILIFLFSKCKINVDKPRKKATTYKGCNFRFQKWRKLCVLVAFEKIGQLMY